MLVIGKPEVLVLGEKARLTCAIQENETLKNVWYEVDAQYAPYLYYERCDAFLVGLLSYAMRFNHDIKCLGPVSEELLFKVCQNLLPSLAKHCSTLYWPSIEAQTEATCIGNTGAVGTGLSCGVDSLHAIKTLHNAGSGLRLTHLLTTNVGSFSLQYNITSSAALTRQKTFERARMLAAELQLPLIEADSNFHREFYQNHGKTHTYSSMFAVLALKKLWSDYFYGSSGYDLSSFSIEDTRLKDPAVYDILSLACMSLRDLHLHSEGCAKKRIEKTATIADFPPAHKYLLVCSQTFYNCGTCPKCLRTLFTLDALGCLDKFDAVFDIASYRKNRKRHFEWLCHQKILHDGGYPCDAQSVQAYGLLMEVPSVRPFLEKITEGLSLNKILRSNRIRLTLLHSREKYIEVLQSLVEEAGKEKLKTFLQNKAYTRIGIYGGSKIAETLSSILKGTATIAYVVADGLSDGSVPRIPLKTVAFPPVDAIIICEISNKDAIRRKLSMLTDIPVASIDEIIGM